MRRADAAVPTGWLRMNLSRAYTLTYGDELSVGRVQTPTLAMVVERGLAVRRFVPEDYPEVVATFRSSGVCITVTIAVRRRDMSTDALLGEGQG
jgi:DNA topoisomerase IA